MKQLSNLTKITLTLGVLCGITIFLCSLYDETSTAFDKILYSFCGVITVILFVLLGKWAIQDDRENRENELINSIGEEIE
jgi:hypothetical protein